MHDKSRQQNAKTMQSKEIPQINEIKKNNNTGCPSVIVAKSSKDLTLSFCFIKMQIQFKFNA